MHNKNSWYAMFIFIAWLVCMPLSVFSQQFDSLVNVSNNPDMYETEPAIAVDHSNHVHIAWTGAYYCPEAPDSVAMDIFYTHNMGGSFTTPVQISVPTGWYSRNPTIAVDGAGNAHIAFRRSEDQMTILVGDDIYYVTNAKGNFDNLLLLVDGTSLPQDSTEVKGPRYPLLHCDSLDYVHLTIQALGLGDTYGDLLLYMNNVGGDWGDPVFTGEGNIINSGDYRSYLDNQDKIHFIFADMDGVWYFHNMSGEFSLPISVSSSEHVHPMSPGIAIDSNQNAHVVYRAPFVTPGLPDLFYVNNVSGNFSSWIAVCDYNVYYIPSIAIDECGFVHIAYKKFTAWGGALYYGNNISGDFTFTTCDEMGSDWYPGSCYFALGDSSILHFAFYDWLDRYTDIFYLRGNWAALGIEQEDNLSPQVFLLNQNFPNPFSIATTIRYELPIKSPVSLRIFNISGQEVEMLVNGEQCAGRYEVKWKTKNLPCGIYFCSLEAGDFSQVTKMILIR